MADEGPESKNRGIDRRTILQSAAAISVSGFVGVPAFSGSTVAESSDETLYLTDTQDDPEQSPSDNEPFGSPSDDTTKLYEVDLSGGDANLTEVFDFNNDTSIDENDDGVGDYNHVVAIAASIDGNTIYGIDKFTDRLGEYDVENDSFSDVGKIGGPGTTLQAAVSPDGTLYITGFGDSGFYEVDTSSPSATRVATITDADGNELEAGGADFTFDADGNLYFVDARSDPRALYKITDITDWSNTVSQVTTGSFGPGLAILDKGNGNLVYSDSENDQLVELDAGGSQVATYPLKEDGNAFDHQFGDLAIAEFAASTSFDLCADQDTTVGTVTVSDSPDEITVTFETTGGWELYETHVDIGDGFDDFPTAGHGNPKVGQFDLSGTHDGETTASYTVECGDEALSDVEDYSELLIAAHAVVKPADGCADFTSFEVGESVEGLGSVNPVLDIESLSSVSGAEAVAQKEGEKPATYGAPTASGSGGSAPNGCLNSYGDGKEGFSDVETKNAKGSHAYQFTFAESVSASDFSVRMLDFGDYNPDNKERHRVEMVAYNEDGDEVDTQTLEYTSDGSTNPDSWSPVEGTSKTNEDLQKAGDGCDAVEGEPGNYVWSVSGDAIVRVELEVVEGTDPNIAFTDLCFTTNDETAWVCDQNDVETFTDRGNWARYLEYTTELFEGC